MNSITRTTLPSGLSARTCEPAHADQTEQTLLLLHGMMGGTWQFDLLQPALGAAGYRSVAIDYRGHHDSPTTKPLNRLSVSDYLHDALQACHAIGGKPIVVGQALGGLVGLMLAERDAVSAAVLLCALPPRGIAWRGNHRPRLAFRRWPGAIRGLPMAPRRKELDELVLNRIPAQRREELFQRQVPESSRVAAQVAYGLVTVDSTAVQCPVLSVGASDDRLVAPSVARKLAEQYHGDHLELRGAGHYALVGEPGWETGKDHIVDWLNRLPSHVRFRR